VSADACVKEACTPEELKIAQAMLWDHLEGNDCPGMRQQRPIGWKQGAPETWVEGHGDGAMTSTTHCDAMWYIRTRPGVVGGFRAAYQEHGVVAAYGAPSPSACRRLAPQANGHELTRMRTDRMMINLPTSTQNEATLAMAERNYRHGKLNAQGLHTHYNQVCTCFLVAPSSAELTGSAPLLQDGYGDDELICYAILPIFDMNRETGATAIVRECLCSVNGSELSG